MRIKNKTKLQFAKTVTSRHPPTPEMVAIVIADFDLVADGPMTLCEGDPGVDTDPISGERYREDDDDATGELLYPGDFAPFKPHGEVLYLGHAHAPPPKREAGEWPVQLRLGSVKKSLRVFGPRVWNAHVVGKKFTDPKPITTVPIDYAHAFGGPGYADNPVGRGAPPPKQDDKEPTSKEIIDEEGELPLVELAETIRSPKDRPAPASFGPINPRWPYRAKKVGKNYGASWRKNRAPYYADDFDWTHWQAAAKDQWNDGPWRGDETLGLVNLLAEHVELECQLPSIRPRVFVQNDREERREVSLKLDTVTVMGDTARVRLAWRGLTEARDSELADMQFVLVVCESMHDEPAPADQYLKELAAFAADPAGLAAFKEAAAKKDADALIAAAVGRVGDEGHTIEGAPTIGSAASGSGPAGDDPVSLELYEQLGDQQMDVQKQIAEAIKKAEAQLAKPISGDHLPPEAASSVKQANEKKDAVNLREKLAEQIGASKAKKQSPPPKGATAASPSPRVALKKQLAGAKEQLAKSKEEAKAGIEEAKKRGADVAAAEAELARFEELEAALSDPALAQFDPSIADGGKDVPDVLGPGVDASGCDFEGRDLSGLDLTEANLDKANLSGCKLVGTKLTRASLVEALLVGADLGESDLANADLTQANLSDARAQRANFAGAKVDRVVMVDADLTEAKLDQITGEQLTVRTTLFTSTSGHGLRLSASTFTGSTFDNADWTGAELFRCRLDEAHLKGFCLKNGRAERTSFADSDLTDAVLDGLIARKSVWLGCNLGGASMIRVILHRAQLTGAKIVGADLFGADLRFSRIDRADMSETIAERANFFSTVFNKSLLTKTRFDHANLYDAKFLEAAGHEAHFDGANLKKARFNHDE